MRLSFALSKAKFAPGMDAVDALAATTWRQHLLGARQRFAAMQIDRTKFEKEERGP